MIGQRALWTFLLLTLAGPFFAGLLAALYTPVAIWANVAPFTAGDNGNFDFRNLPDGRGITQLMMLAAIKTFVWAPIAAAIAGLGMVALLITRGEVGWALAGGAGVIGFFVAYLIFPFDAGGMLALFALGAGLLAAFLSILLVRIGVLPPPG